MWLDLIALAVLAVFVALGAARGALITGLGLATLAGAYAASVFLAPALAPALGERLNVSDFWGLALAGTGVFIATYAILGGAAAALRRLSRRRDEPLTRRDRFFGGVFGAIRGLAIVLLVSYLALWMDALRATGGTSPLPAVGSSRAAALTGEVVESGLEAVLDADDPAARVVVRLAARPQVAVGELQAVLDAPQIAQLRSDGMFWTYVENGNVDAALARRSYLALQRDEAMRRRFADLGLVPEEAAENDAAFRAAVAEVLRDVGPQLRGLKNDPALRELAEDPQVVAMVQSGDTLGLLGHPGFRKLVERVTSRPSSD